MNDRSKAKRLLTTMAVVVALLVSVVPLLAYKANPPGGSRRGNDWQIHVVDAGPDSSVEHELVTDGGFNFSQMTSNSTLRAWFVRSFPYSLTVGNTDTARVHITGIGTDSAYVDTSFKLAVGDTLTTARTFYMFESAWVDTAVNGPIKIWTTTGSVTTTLLDSIPAGRLERPMAHRLFGKQHNPTLNSVVLTHQAAIDTLHYEVRYFPNLANYRQVSSRKMPTVGGKRPYEVLGDVKLDVAQSQAIFLINKVLDPYSAVGVFARETAVANGVTASVTISGEYR